MPLSQLAARRTIGRALATAAGGIAWLLRDDFTTDLPAGSVNGTAAEPGPGTRSVIDAESKISISSGKLQFAAKAAGAHGNQTLILDACSRIAGRILVASITTGNGLIEMPIWGNNTTPYGGGNSNFAVGIYWYPSSFAIKTAAHSAVIVGSQTLGNTYLVCHALRATGAMTFIKMTSWELFWIEHTGSVSPVYPGHHTYNLAASSDFIRVPDALWLPTPLASDGFGSAFGTTDGMGHAEGIAGGIGAGGSGVTWSNVGSTWSVSGGKAINTPTLGANVLVNGDFSAWTGDNPNGWTLPVAEDANNYTTEVSGALRFVATAGSLFRLEQNSLNANTWYAGVVDVSSVTTIICLASNAGSPAITITTSGSKTWTGRAAGTYARIWTENSTGAGTIDNFTFKPMVLSELLALSNPVCSDIFASVIITRPNTYTQPGLALNWNSSTSPTSGVVVYLNGSIITIEKCVAGAWSLVANANFTYSAGAALVVAKTGTEYRVFYNNALVTAQTISDVSIINNTLHGLFSTDPSNTFDNFTVYPRGTGGEYATLDQYIQP